jgi:tartrate dehydrogenase/decarboxylase / D-malate dehydrogenase
MRSYSIAVIPGDGVGQEVIPAGISVLEAAAEVVGGLKLNFDSFPWSCQYYLETGRMMPIDALTTLEAFDAIYLGAIGDSRVPDDVSLWGLLLPIRQGFDLYVNLRPIRVLEGITSPLRAGTTETVDILCVRENTEGEYAGVGGRFARGTTHEFALQTSVFTRAGIERVARFAFERALERRHLVASATKSNALQYSAVLWDEVLVDVAARYPDVRLESYHIDALAARFITAPGTLDVVVASNLFGDILTDLGGAIQGSLGIPASANLNPERAHPSMFEPIHGSAPRRAGKGIANPMAAAWAGSLMLDFLGEREAAALVMGAIESLARGGPHTPDLGGKATTKEVADAAAAALRAFV